MICDTFVYNHSNSCDHYGHRSDRGDYYRLTTDHAVSGLGFISNVGCH